MQKEEEIIIGVRGFKGERVEVLNLDIKRVVSEPNYAHKTIVDALRHAHLRYSRIADSREKVQL